MSNETAVISLKEKIDDLNKHAWEVRVTDLPKAFELSQESVKLSRSINYPRGLAEGLRSLGFSYVRFFKNDQAAPLLNESLSLFQTLNDLTGQAIVYEYLGIIERNWGNLGTSLELLLKGNDLIRQTDPPEIEITSCYQIGVTYKHLGNHESALDYLYRTLSLAKKINFTLMEAYAIHIIGSIYFDNGNYHQALDCYQQGLIIRQESGDKWGEAGSLDNIGFTYLKLNDLDKAIEYCKQSLAICQATDDKKGEANALLHLGEIYEQAGDFKKAAGFSNESLEIRKARGDKRGETEVLLFLADLHKNRNDVEDHQIFDWLSGALKIADEIKAQDLLSKTYYNLHEYYQQKGNFKESLVHLEAHFQIEKELHKNSINQKIASLEISHKAEVVSQRNKELTELNEKIEKANEELKIEASLERVRTVAMSMMKPADLLEICKVLYKELLHLGFTDLRNVIIHIFNDDNKYLLDYDYSEENGGYITKILYGTNPVLDRFLKQIKVSQDAFAEVVVDGNELNEWRNYRLKTGQPSELRLEEANALYYYFHSIGLGDIGLSTFKPVKAQHTDILKRFRNVFGLAYRRYTDITAAEAQAREAQIEAALEKVRSRSLAMHKSDELNEVVAVLFEKLKELHIPVTAVGIAIYIEGSKDMNAYVCGENEDGLVITNYRLPYFHHKISEDFNNTREKQLDFFIGNYSKDEKNSFYKYVFEHTAELRHLPDDIKRMIFESPTYTITMVAVNNATFNINDFEGKVLSESEIDIIKRFAKVFDQAYTRFLDLQKAEAQAREAKIEVALEKVRSRTMGMQRSEELGDVATVLFKEMNQLVENLWTCGFVLCERDRAEDEWWLSTETGFIPAFYLPHTGDATHVNIYNGWRNGEAYHTEQLEGEALKEHYEWLYNIPVAKKIFDEMMAGGFLLPTWQKLHCAYFSKGYLCIITQVPCQEEPVFKRFAQVFDLTYTRFLDLKKAEAQAREAQIEAALERVRSRTMGMQKSDELKDVIQVVYEQFVHLNINIEHTGFVMDYKARDDYDIWIADQLGVPSHVTIPYFDSVYYNRFNEAKEKGEDFFAANLDFEEKNKFYQKIIEHVPGLPDEAKEFLFSVPGLAISTVLLENVCLYIENFSGIPYSEEENATLMRFGKVFQQTYTRFNDLKLAEAHAVQAEEDLVKLQTEKKRAEDALAELQVTQKQLIQAEKMASLGELTAGIAHEIQNPLNFVNNFSDVNKELLVEMKEEIEKGNTEEVIAIANDIISNEEKINHHGKRADAIVKGMLQHSRSSSGVKEPTDINELADEYLRLAYHGLRAKDKSFNATMKTDFDEAIGKVNVIPQDIGRVFLNLITNAFYVVSEKKRQLANGYEPTVTVTTKKESDKVVVSVKDNGNGIPQKVLDKIFQPFFTTKPTGQGTGLGLSLSYDIVKAHNGEIKVKTKDGEGSEFVIQLPIDQ